MMKKRNLLYFKRLLLAFILGVTLPSHAQVVELLKDIAPAEWEPSAMYNFMTTYNGKLFIYADDNIYGGGTYGAELWVSDGTEAGTQLLKDIYPGLDASEAGWANNFTTCNNKLFFIAQDGVHGHELWATDGTEAGTYLVKDVHPDDGGGLGSGSSDQLYTYNGKVYFAGTDGDPYFGSEFHGEELWCSDGTAAGTYMLIDIRPNDPTNYGTSGGQPRRFCEFNGLLYFEAYDGLQGENGGHSGELWVTDGTEVGTHLVNDIAQEQYSETPRYLTPCGDKMFFRTHDGAHGIELWATDGTEDGTYLVKDIFPGVSSGMPNSSYPKYLTNVNGTLFFRANSYVQGDEVIADLWKSDGTEEGTVNLSEQAGVHGIINLKAYGDMVVFLAYDGSNYSNYELYSWSEAEGVHLIKEINPSPTGGIDFNPEINFPEGFVQYKDKLYFRAASDIYGTILWQTDGTVGGTMQTPGQPLEIPNPLSPQNIMDFTFKVNNGSLYYPAWYNDLTAAEVYKLTVAPIEVFTVSGSGDYCIDGEGLPVVLSGSEEGVTYTLIKDGVAQVPTIAGTGGGISFGNQLAGTYTVTGTNAAGNIDMIGNAVINAVTSLPVNVSISADLEEVCAGSPVTITALPVNGGTNPVYQWYLNNNTVGSNQVQFIYMPTDGDMVEVELTSDLSCAANVGESNIIILTVNEIVTPEVSIVASENPVYSADPVTFTPTPVNGGVPTYEWYVNDALVGTDVTYEYLPINEDQVYVVMTSSVECVTSATDTSNVIEMVVNNGIPAAYTVTGSGNYCEDSDGLPVGLSDSEIGVLYTLYKDGVAQVPTVDGTGEVISFGNQLEGVYTVSGTNANTTTTMAGSAEIVEIENLPVSVTIAPDHEPMCSATPITFYAYPENAGDEPTYQWYVNGITVTGNNFEFYQYVPVNEDEVYVEVTSSLECTTNNPATSDVYSLEVLPTLLAEVSLEIDDNSVCQGTSVTFTATPVNGGEEPKYSWLLNDEFIIDTTDQSTYTYVPSDGDYVRVVMIPDEPCTSGTASSITIFVTVTIPVTPEVTISASANPSFIGYPVTFTPAPVNGGDYPIYEWYVNNEHLGSGEVFEYIPEDGDQVSTIMISSYECASPMAVLSNVIVMTVDDGSIPVISISPNGIAQSVSWPNGQATQEMLIENNGEGELNWSAEIEYLGPYDQVAVPEGPVPEPLNLSLATTGSGSGTSPMEKDRETVVLNYDGDNFDGIGLQSGGTFTVATRFPSDMTLPYSGYALESVDVFINEAPSSATLMIWDAGTTTTPGTLLHEQSFSGSGWLTIVLTESVEITGNDIWVGYTVTHAAGVHPAGADAGPANANGDWISTDGASWSHLASMGYSYNWNIRANLTATTYDWLSLDQLSGTVSPGESQLVEVNFDATGLDNSFAYTANILVSSNDPEIPVFTVPVMMTLMVGVDENQISQILVYPNPTEDKLYIKLNTSQTTTASLIMTDLKGQKITEKTFVGEASLDVSSYPAGIYLMKVIIGDSGKVCKIVIK